MENGDWLISRSEVVRVVVGGFKTYEKEICDVELYRELDYLMDIVIV